MYEIEKDIPAPVHMLAVNKRKYPFDTMVVGDSITVPISLRQSACTCANTFARKNEGVHFTSKKVSDDTIRIWRVS